MLRPPSRTGLRHGFIVLMNPHEQLEDLFWREYFPTLAEPIMKDARLLLTEFLEFIQQGEALE